MSKWPSTAPAWAVGDGSDHGEINILAHLWRSGNIAYTVAKEMLAFTKMDAI